MFCATGSTGNLDCWRIGESCIGTHSARVPGKEREKSPFLSAGVRTLVSPGALLDRTQALVTEKEECTVLDDGAAQGDAELVLLQHLLGERSDDGNSSVASIAVLRKNSKTSP